MWNVSGIRQILDEMIYNICENAIKYNKENGKVNIWVGNTLNGKKKVIVQDTGIGIPKEHQDRIFERFTRWIRAIPERPVEQVWIFRL